MADTTYTIYARTDSPGELLGWLQAESPVEAAYKAWKRWPGQPRIYVTELLAISHHEE